MKLQLELSTFDVTGLNSLEMIAGVVEGIVSNSSSNFLLLPELLWLPGFPDLATDQQKARECSNILWREQLPHIANNFNNQNRLLVLGTAPCWIEIEQEFRNRAIIIREGELLYQDKLCLTPWEERFAPGKELNVFKFKDVHVAVPVGFDIEIPEIAAKLKEARIDCVLVPAASDSQLSWERIQRCSSARSVELCAYVATAHLLGESTHESVSENQGAITLYCPAHSRFGETDRHIESPYRTGGFLSQSHNLNFSEIDTARIDEDETNPLNCKLERDVSTKYRA